jgi:mannitol/fructose-specific phosphotransferase system IIA component (Ntr-type)
VLGRSAEGIEFSSQSQKPVRLVLLLVTPLEHPDVQLTLLAQLARLAADESARRGIAAAASAEEIIDIIAEDRQPIASSEIGAETNAE